MGMNSSTGGAISGLTELRQQIRDVLTTPIGSRVGNRAYGSRLFDLQDAPLNRSTIVEIYAATAEAISTWVPNFKVKTVQVEELTEGGKISLTVSGDFLPEGRDVQLDGIKI
jgi:phage baseplate assembly protein W